MRHKPWSFGSFLSDLPGIALIFLMGAFIIAGVYGWIANVIAIFHTADLPFTGMFLIRVIGIFVAPIGAIAGYL